MLPWHGACGRSCDVTRRRECAAVVQSTSDFKLCTALASSPRALLLFNHLQVWVQLGAGSSGSLAALGGGIVASVLYAYLKEPWLVKLAEWGSVKSPVCHAPRSPCSFTRTRAIAATNPSHQLNHAFVRVTCVVCLLLLLRCLRWCASKPYTHSSESTGPSRAQLLQQCWRRSSRCWRCTCRTAASRWCRSTSCCGTRCCAARSLGCCKCRYC